MSLVFLKSEDKQGGGSSNPNKPYRFSNYLTQPITLPPNSQVSYVSSQYSLNTDVNINNEPSYIQTEDELSSVLNMPVQVTYDNVGKQQGTIYNKVNRYILSANEFGMDADYTGLKYEEQAYYGQPQEVSTTGYQLLYDAANEKTEIKTKTNVAIDQYNLYFNSGASNPPFNSASWSNGPGSSVPVGINWAGTTDNKFKNDISFISINAPSGTTSLHPSNNYGFSIGGTTNSSNALSSVYAGGANFYNTGFSSTGLESNAAYSYSQSTTLTDFPDFNLGLFPMNIMTTAIKKSVGNFEPSDNAQQSNTGGHITPGGFGIASGGYSVFGFTNTNQSEANIHFDAAATSKVGYCGIGEQYVGVHSIPYLRDYGYEISIASGFDEDISRDKSFQLQQALQYIDLNESVDPDDPQGNLARYVFGCQILERVESTGDIRLTAQAEVLSPCGLTGKDTNISNSSYIPIGEELDIYELSRGINTAVDPPYIFETGGNYGINTFNTTSGRTPASLFFRYRWVNKNQMNLEFTLSVDGYPGTYDPNTDSVFQAPGFIPNAPSVPDTPQTIQLDDDTTGTSVNITTQTLFTDSGGTGGGYAPDEEYEIVFVAPTGTNASFTINDFEFEHSSFAMYDRLGIQKSTDGVTWTNVSFTGFYSSATTTPPYSTSFGSPKTPGWIFPENIAKLESEGGSGTATYDVGTQYVKFIFYSDGSQQRRGWSLNMGAVSSSLNIEPNDPRDKWCVLASMTQGENKYILPSYLGDLGLVQYPVAASDNTANLRFLHKGWYEPRETNRFYQDNNNGGGEQYAPFSPQNPFYYNDFVGTLVYNLNNEIDPTKTSSNLINANYTGNVHAFNSVGILNNEVYYLSVPTKYLETDFFLSMTGSEAFDVNQPKTETGYVLGFRVPSDPTAIVELQEDPGDSSVFSLVSENTIQPSEESFTNHIQLTNLPLISQNGVVSSVAKSIFIANTLCVHSTQDMGSYRFFCDRAPYPMWIDLNNLEKIELNRLDVLITDDNNIEQNSLGGSTEIVIMFRQKEQGGLPNTIPVKSMSFTRTY